MTDYTSLTEDEVCIIGVFGGDDRSEIPCSSTNESAPYLQCYYVLSWCTPSQPISSEPSPSPHYISNIPACPDYIPISCPNNNMTDCMDYNEDEVSIIGVFSSDDRSETPCSSTTEQSDERMCWSTPSQPSSSEPSPSPAENSPYMAETPGCIPVRATYNNGWLETGLIVQLDKNNEKARYHGGQIGHITNVSGYICTMYLAHLDIHLGVLDEILLPVRPEINDRAKVIVGTPRVGILLGTWGVGGGLFKPDGYNLECVPLNHLCKINY